MTPRSTALVATALLNLTVAPAFATSTKTWVSSTGTDTGACPLTAPCKTFQYAYSQTAAGGEIDVKDSGSYGPVMITQAISIVSGDGALAAVGMPSGGIGIDVAAGPQDKVVLEGLFVDGHGAGATGIKFDSGRSLIIENCHVRNVMHTAIDLEPANAFAFSIVNTEVSGAADNGVFLYTSNTINGAISGLFAHDNGTGVFVRSANVSIVNSVLIDNGDGLDTAGQANVLIGQTTVSENQSYGLDNSGGKILSYGDNYINANYDDVGGTLSSIGRR